MKKCLIVVDYQVDFVSGTLGFEKAVEIEDYIAEKIKKYRSQNCDIIFTFDTHSKDYLETYEGKYLPVKHCINGTDGHKLYGKVAKLIEDKDKRIYKPAFGSDELFDYLRRKDYSSVELCGVVSNICVMSNAVIAKTALPEADIIVDTACIASNDDMLNQNTVNIMKSLQIKII